MSTSYEDDIRWITVSYSVGSWGYLRSSDPFIKIGHDKYQTWYYPDFIEELIIIAKPTVGESSRVIRELLKFTWENRHLLHYILADPMFFVTMYNLDVFSKE